MNKQRDRVREGKWSTHNTAIAQEYKLSCGSNTMHCSYSLHQVAKPALTQLDQI